MEQDKIYIEVVFEYPLYKWKNNKLFFYNVKKSLEFDTNVEHLDRIFEDFTVHVFNNREQQLFKAVTSMRQCGEAQKLDLRNRLRKVPVAPLKMKVVRGLKTSYEKQTVVGVGREAVFKVIEQVGLDKRSFRDALEDPIIAEMEVLKEPDEKVINKTITPSTMIKKCISFH